MIALAVVALALAALPAAVYLRNAPLFNPPPSPDVAHETPRVSVLIPARNEEHAIGPAVTSVLASTGVELEVVVLDDHSTDGTATVVRKLATGDPRVRLETAPALPAGWCGKQHACFALSKLARHDVLVFLDADVRLAPDALARIVTFLRHSEAGLVSGFPRQETGTFLERLVIPLINWLLLCYLPMDRMRKSLQPSFGAGCGQFFVTTRAAYDRAGGHASVKSSLHDGVTLPRAYRRAGLMTDICDATDLATCRMYRSAGQVWFGLAKNAGEGLGAWPAIVVWTGLLAGGHVLPWVLVAVGLDFAFHGEIAHGLFPESRPSAFAPAGWVVTGLSLAAVALSLAPRLAAARRFRASWLGAALHPLGVTVLLAIQWYAAIRHVIGKPVGWKGRTHPSLALGTDDIAPTP